MILRALSVKEHATDVPVVVQLHRKRSAQYLRDASVDVVVPMDEIRMARPSSSLGLSFCFPSLTHFQLILGQNCMAPGFSTLISNLVHTFSPKQESVEFSRLWAEEYCAFNEIFIVICIMV